MDGAKNLYNFDKSHRLVILCWLAGRLSDWVTG